METLLKKRTALDFSKHEIIVVKENGLLIHHLKIPKQWTNNIKFINTNNILAVTGDFGNWIFCREFHPSKDGYVSDGYWHEKLNIASTQDGKEIDWPALQKEIKTTLDGTHPYHVPITYDITGECIRR